MAVTKVNFELGNLLEKISNSTHGEVQGYADEKLYLKDVKKRVPKIEKALDDLKKYLDGLSS